MELPANQQHLPPSVIDPDVQQFSPLLSAKQTPLGHAQGITKLPAKLNQNDVTREQTSNVQSHEQQPIWAGKQSQQSGTFQNPKGRIWVAWKPQVYRIQILKITEQMIHCEAHNVNTPEKFFITYVYGFNLAQERLPLWEGLQTIANSMSAAWCVLGDFNTILHTKDRMGGTEVNDSEITDFSNCLLSCELEELRNSGSYYSWTNKRYGPESIEF
ncbi:hypothetical protein Cgig2_015619 [Carnegiea gigantea]|uniref:Uncharacterized protein n=1 Tax=Carnegiea gigantea TaxID=171969 RepID=A0A9Q1JP02_9CARY|nr:hypothetical protein Cgig2_015619 [Carnegiea gigantea]